MSKKTKKFTPAQQEIIDFDEPRNMLVSASAGTGKTDTMIARIARLIEKRVDVSEIVVVTFTNLAAAEMKDRLGKILLEKRNNSRVFEQLERLDSANICTLHSFCSDLLRNYFYVVDIDPAFAILDDATVSTLKRNTLDAIFEEYFENDDDEFMKVYKIFSTHRREDKFREVLLRLYSFSRCLEDFSQWYQSKKSNLDFSEDNPIVKVLRDDVKQTVTHYRRSFDLLADNSRNERLAKLTEYLEQRADLLNEIRLDTLEHAVTDLCGYDFGRIPAKPKEMGEVEAQIRAQYEVLRKELKDFRDKYAELFRVGDGQSLASLWEEYRKSVACTDKLVEIVTKFDAAYFEAKKQRGGVDYDDLEHLCLKLLQDEHTREEIHSRYKMIFVDEYQDTNPIQEAIVKLISTPTNLFMVGDVKQSIYGFRGCEPSIFTDKYDSYKKSGVGCVKELNENFRANKEILDFVNVVFNRVMTASFGKVDYKGTAQLVGNTAPSLKAPSTRVDFLLADKSADKEIVEGLYDVTAEVAASNGMTQGELIAHRIKEYVGKTYRDSNDNECRIDYGDIVILMRGMTDKAIEIYDSLVNANIPVSASFKVEALANKEIKDAVNFLRVLDNPYVDVSMVGVCLSPLGGFDEAELGVIRLDTPGRTSFYERLVHYAKNGKNLDMGAKIRAFLDFLEEMRFYSRSAAVDEVLLRLIQKTDYHLYVLGLPNGALRLKKLYAFIDGLKGATYAQSVDKFLSYVDETDNAVAEGLSQTGVVRIMTMHASKGLGFPIVFLAGLESKINFDYPAVEQNVDLGLATCLYDFGAMSKADTLGYYALRLVNQSKQREEEMRLLYVAMTRAKFLLNIVATTTEDALKELPKLPSRARTHLDWVLPAVVDLRDTGTVRNLDVNIPPIFGNGDAKSDKKDYLCAQLQPKDAAKIIEQIAYVYPFANETKMPSKIVSSALDKEYIDSSEQPQPDFTIYANSDANFIGTAYHKLYQYLPLSATVEQIKECLAELIAQGKIEQRFEDKIDVQLIHDTLRNSELLKLLEGGEVYHEIPFMLNVPYSEVAKDKRFNDEVMLQGVIDLLVLKDKRAVVVDFKYTSRSDLVEERYTMQLNSYKMAVERIIGITDVTTYVLSIADNKLIKM